MEENDVDTEQGGDDVAGVQLILQSRHPVVGVALCCREMGCYPPHGMGPGRIPRPGGVATDIVASMAKIEWDMGVHLSGGGNR